MNEAKMKKQRIHDFKKRIEDDPAGTRTLRAGGQVVTIHPMADEKELLASLEMSPSDCIAVDAYWAVDGDVVFLQLHTAKSNSHRASGFYARVAKYPPKYVNLFVVVEGNEITSEVLEGAEKLKRAGWDRSQLGDTLVPLAQMWVPKGGGNNLFRVVDDVELAVIKKTSAFISPPGTLE